MKTETLAVIIAIMLWSLALAFIAVIAGSAFQYTLFTFFGKDVPFWLDVLAGLVLSALNIPLFVVSLIVRHLGFDVPVFDSP